MDSKYFLYVFILIGILIGLFMNFNNLGMTGYATSGEYSADSYGFGNYGVFLNLFQNCVEGLPCPGQIQVPFFGFYNLIITIFLIFGIYLIYLKKQLNNKN